MSEAQPSDDGRDLADLPLSPPTANNGLLAVFQKRYLLRLLVRREISARYRGSFLGLMWSYINPAAQFFVYFMVMGVILNLRDIPWFGIHLFAGLVVVGFFTETFGAGTRSIVRNSSIVTRMPLPREMFPVASMLTSLYHMGPQLVILVIACLAVGWMPDPVGMLAFLIAVVMIILLGTAAALMFSVANVYLRDFGNIVNVLQLFVRFGVPMIYPYSLVDERFGPLQLFGYSLADFYLFNPLSIAVLLVQRAFWTGTEPDLNLEATELPDHLLERGVLFIVISAILLVIAQLVFTRFEKRVPERL
jgi:ABC-2 type transport system permease protein